MMSILIRVLLTAGLIATMIAASNVAADEYRGTLSAGYVFTDITGNRSIHQPTFNLYEGAALSLDDFRYRWDNGLVLTARGENLTMNNRNLGLGFGKVGVAGANLNHSSYRRTYDFEGVNFTRRRQTSASLWLKPSDKIKLIGGYGIIDKHGKLLDLIVPSEYTGVNIIDYSHSFYSLGAEYRHRRSYGRIDYRVSSFCDDLDDDNDRSSRRLRLTAYTPVPQFDAIVLNGGIQHYEQEIDNRYDTLTANTYWGGVRYMHALGYRVEYSFMFDRARRTGDLTDTDNLLHTFQVGRTWRGRGGVTVGYGHRINDEVRVERSGNEYTLSGWVKLTPELDVRAGISSRTNAVDSGRTLTGDRDYARHWISAKYRLASSSARLKLESRSRSNDNVGTSIDFIRFSTDVFVTDANYGQLSASWSYGDGEYENVAGLFDFSEHVIAGELMSREYHKFQGGFGGSFYRARQDVDVEAFTVRFTGRYRLHPRAVLEVIYSAHNFDNFDDVSVPYSEYYTANVVETRVHFDL